MLDARPQGRIAIPEDTILPLFMAITLVLIFWGILVSLPPLIIAGVVVALLTVAVWFWPRKAAGA